MRCSIAAMKSATVGKLPRRSAWRVMIEKNASTRFSQDPEVGVKCRWGLALDLGHAMGVYAAIGSVAGVRLAS
jgi:hypothetical protein